MVGLGFDGALQTGGVELHVEVGLAAGGYFSAGLQHHDLRVLVLYLTFTV